MRIAKNLSQDIEILDTWYAQNIAYLSARVTGDADWNIDLPVSTFISCPSVDLFWRQYGSISCLAASASLLENSACCCNSCGLISKLGSLFDDISPSDINARHVCLFIIANAVVNTTMALPALIFRTCVDSCNLQLLCVPNLCSCVRIYVILLNFLLKL